MANIEHICRECKAETRVEKHCSASASERALSHPKKGLCLCGHYNNRRHRFHEHLTKTYPPWLSLEDSLGSNSPSSNIQRFYLLHGSIPCNSPLPCNSKLNATPSPFLRLLALKRLPPLLPHTLCRTQQDVIIQSIHYFAFSNLPVINP